MVAVDLSLERQFTLLPAGVVIDFTDPAVGYGWGFDTVSATSYPPAVRPLVHSEPDCHVRILSGGRFRYGRLMGILSDAFVRGAAWLAVARSSQRWLIYPLDDIGTPTTVGAFLISKPLFARAAVTTALGLQFASVCSHHNWPWDAALQARRSYLSDCVVCTKHAGSPHDLSFVVGHDAHAPASLPFVAHIFGGAAGTAHGGGGGGSGAGGPDDGHFFSPVSSLRARLNSMTAALRSTTSVHATCLLYINIGRLQSGLPTRPSFS
jgi:hypothetical protein